jgi:DNA invertase Pin-like site-specific DNA recombinase
MDIDLTTAAGRMMARTVVNFAEYERELISERTKAGLAAKKARGEKIGRPREASPALVRGIVTDRDNGLTFDRIARALETEGTLSSPGGHTWHSSTARRIYASATAAKAVA